MDLEIRSKEEVINRLRRVEGQIRGIQRMITQDRACEDVATQLLAARAALDRASLVVLSNAIEHCLLDETGHTDADRLERVISFFLKFAAGDPAGMSAATDLES